MPNDFANWIAASPTPLAPAWIKTFCPGRNSEMVNRAWYAVNQFSGTAAAWTHETCRGFRVNMDAGVAMYSAYAPPIARPNLGHKGNGKTLGLEK